MTTKKIIEFHNLHKGKSTLKTIIYTHIQKSDRSFEYEQGKLCECTTPDFLRSVKT
jgi:hypothetical protein